MHQQLLNLRFVEIGLNNDWFKNVEMNPAQLGRGALG